jgi:hypothetical protein
VTDTEPPTAVPPTAVPPTADQPEVSYPRWLWVVGVVVVVIVGGAIALLVFVVDSGDDVTAGGGAIERLIPANNSQIVQQQEVGVQLRPGFDATLRVNDTDIPEAQLKKTTGIYQVTFQPGPDKAVKQLEPGPNCVTVTYWRVEVGPEDSSQHAWCFTVV